MKKSIFFFFAFLLAAGLMTSGLVSAATLSVNSTDDLLADDGVCTLREAIIAANTDSASGLTDGECNAGESGSDTIELPAGPYTLSLIGSEENDSATGDLDILDDLILTGAGADSTTIDASVLTDLGDPDRVFHLFLDKTVEISGVTITGGSSITGGGIWNDSSTGTLTLKSVTVSGNTSISFGAGIRNAGILNILDSFISGNTTTSGGGGIANYENPGAVISITNSTVSGNSANDGGGIYHYSGTTEITTSTISGNTVGDDGGGIYGSSGTVRVTNSTISDNSGGGGISNASSSLTVTNSTISGNASKTSGGGLNVRGGTTHIYSTTITSNTSDSNSSGGFKGGGLYTSASDPVTVKDTIIADNTDKGGNSNDCYGTINSEGYNLIKDTTDCTIGGDTTGNITGEHAYLNPLKNNGGPTETHALQATSSAINAGDPSGCTDAHGTTLATDQRGASRDGTCDIGAYEKIPTESDCSDQADNDNDGSTDCDDSDCSGSCSTWYLDSDGDEYGDSSNTTSAVSQPPGYVADSTDCDVDNPSVNPGATESCEDSVDNNCDNFIDCDDDDCSTNAACTGGDPETACEDEEDNDEDGAIDCDDSDCAGSCSTWYLDSDEDGYGDSSHSTSSVSRPSGYVNDSTDCNDNDSSVNPKATETCNDSTDNDCDEATDCADSDCTSDSACVSGGDKGAAGAGGDKEEATPPDDKGADLAAEKESKGGCSLVTTKGRVNFAGLLVLLIPLGMFIRLRTRRTFSFITWGLHPGINAPSNQGPRGAESDIVS